MTVVDLFNPGFEGTTADAQSVATAGDMASITADATAPHSGSSSLKWNPSTTTNVDLTVTPKATGQTTTYIPSQRGTHTFTFWTRTNLAQGEHTLVMRLRAYDLGGNLLGEQAIQAPGAIPISTTWQQFTITQSPVTGTAYIQPVVEIHLTNDLNNASFYIDDLALDVVPEAAPAEPRLSLLDSLRLEVEVPAEGLQNLVPNPSGDLGAWGWVTPVPNTFIDVQSNTDGPYLRFKTTVSQAAYWTSTFMSVLAGQWVAARFDTVFATTSHNVVISYEWYDTSKTLLSTTVAQSSGFDATVRTNYVPTKQAPTGTAYAKLRFDFYNGTSNPVANTFYGLRKVMFTTNSTNTFSTTRNNLVPNPSFEVNTTGWTAGPGTPTAIARSTTVGGYKGTAALRLTASAAGSISATSDYIPVSPGQDYAYQAQFRAGTTGRSVVTMIEWSDSTKVPITSTGKNATDKAGAWTMSSNVMTAPTNAAYARVVAYVWSAAAGEVHYVDAVMLEQSTSVGTYFDGSFASAGTLTYSWNGTANNSSSKETNTSFAFADPSTWQNILGPSHEIRIEREALNVGTLSATVLDALLDPAVADTLRPGKQVRLTALKSADEWQPIFTGMLTSADVTYDLKNPKTDRQVNIALTATDNIATLANTAETDVVATIANLAYVLEEAGVPWNLNGSGNQVANPTVVATNDNASVVDQIAITRDTARGYAWVDRFNVLQAFDAAQMPVAQSVAIDENSYSDLNATFDTDQCVNEVNITWLRYNIGTEETSEVSYGPYRDLASIAEWGAHAATFTIAGATEDPTAIANYANAVLVANGNPQVRINSVTLPIRYQSDLTSGKAFYDLYDLVTVSNAEKGLSDLSRITSISHQITPTGWLMTLGFVDIDSVASPQMTPSPTGPVLNPLSGEITLYGGSVAPDGWLLCDGKSYATSAYPSLFAAIGYKFGGSGSTFKVPNLTDRFPIGAGTKALGAVGGGATKTLTAANLPAHSHTIAHSHPISSRETGPGPQNNHVMNSGGTGTLHEDNTSVYGSDTANSGTGNGLSGSAFDVMNPWLAINFIIRA